jgi:superfamily II RNA helicase
MAEAVPFTDPDEIEMVRDDSVPSRPSLVSRIPPGGTSDPDEILDRFIDWVTDAGFELYPAQEQALLEIMAGRHVILNTPTGSGKSLVALGLHFKALCEGRTSYYTSPIKALASEKFFSLCDDFGPENVGMLTGDASINPDARVICCTAEVLANRALREGDRLDVPYVVMDEFHYYSDPERGVAWQIPLITLTKTRFLLMSATLGDVSSIQEHIEEQTGVEVALVSSEDRPVPLDFEYRETPLHETIEELIKAGKAPVYIVNFTQRECAELAQALTSMQIITTREEREKIREAVGDFRFDTPYGKEFRRFISFGIGVHHAGLLPKYRLLCEQLSQQGLLRVISGTDTLGVGVNIPIRTVLFTKLAKFDGKKVSLLSVRDFKQIAGRAGRKGFDDKGSVVAQAPEHIIEKRKSERSGGKKVVRGPAKGEVSWTQETFDKLMSRPPETLKSRFRISHGMVLNLLQRDAELDDPNLRNFDSLRDLIRRCHDEEGAKARHLTTAAVLVRSLYRSGVIRMKRDTTANYLWAVVAEDLQWDFSLHHILSLYLVDTLGSLEPASETYVPDLVTLVESILEDPDAVLRKQVDKLKQELVAQLKAEGMQYEERMERLEEVTHPKPLSDFIYGTFNRFRGKHPWVGGQDIHPKSIGREMFEGYMSFADYVKRYNLQRSEGVLLRYLSQLYKTLDQTVPEPVKTEGVWDALGFFRALVEQTDSSLLEEWEGLLHPEILVRATEREAAREVLWLQELLADPKTFAARVRAEMHLLVRALSLKDWEEAPNLVKQDADEPETLWDADRFAAALAPFFEEYEELLFTPEARRHQWTQIRPSGDRTWEVTHTLLDPQGDNLWALQGTIDLRNPQEVEGPIVRVSRISP